MNLNTATYHVKSNSTWIINLKLKADSMILLGANRKLYLKPLSRQNISKKLQKTLFFLNFIFYVFIVDQGGKGAGSVEHGQDHCFHILFFFLYLRGRKDTLGETTRSLPITGCHPRVLIVEHVLRVLLRWFHCV